MSYNYLKQHNSPNYTPASQAMATWGRPRTVEAIAIHWWGDPNQNPTFEGVISTLCNPNRGASAHFVATGTGRRVACLVDLDNASWATNSANPYTISIECDPRCRDEDYDVIAELIAELRVAYGRDLPLVPHRQFVATACPGNYDLNRLNALSKAKQPHADINKDFGQLVVPAPKPVEPPKPTTVAVPAAKKLPEPLNFTAKLDKVEVWDLATNPNYKSVKTLIKGEGFRAFASIAFNNTTYYLTEYSFNKGLKTGVNQNDLTLVQPPVEPPKQPEPDPNATSQTDRIGAIEKRVSVIETFLQSVFSIFKK